MTCDGNDTMNSEPQEFTACKKNSSATTTDGSNLILLPTEICESILDELAESPETLRACALVCHWFAQRAQKLLFSCICLRRPTRVSDGAVDVSYFSPSNSFLKTISSSPHLAGYVRSLIISDANSFKGPSTYREIRSWLRSSSDNPVHEILPLLAHLEELGIAGNARESLDFLAWGIELRMGILEQCSSHRLVTIRLANINQVPLSLFGLAPRLETLRLKWVSFVSNLDSLTVGRAFDLQEYMKRKAKYPPARLKHLTLTLFDVKEWCTLYAWLASHLDITQLRSLALHLDFVDEEEEMIEDGLRALLNLLNGCSATLETLRFFMPELEDVQYIHHAFEFDVRVMPALRNLHLISWVRYLDSLEAMSLPAGTPSAAPLPGTALRNLTSIISKTLPPSSGDDGERNGGSSPSSDSSHPQLESLTIQLIIHDYYNGTNSRVRYLGWEAFAGVIEDVAAVGRTSSSESEEREVTEVDLRPMMGWETILGEVYRRSMWETKLEIARGAVGATSVTLIASLQAGSNERVEHLLEENFGWLREKGVGFGIHT